MSKPKSKHAKPVTIQEEIDAAKLEIIRPTKPISAGGMKRVNRAHELKRMLAPLEAELEVLKGEILREMDNKGVDVMTRKGIPVVSRDKAVRQDVPKDVLLEKYPEIAAEIIVTKTTYRINWKKPLVIETL